MDVQLNHALGGDEAMPDSAALDWAAPYIQHQ